MIHNIRAVYYLTDPSKKEESYDHLAIAPTVKDNFVEWRNGDRGGYRRYESIIYDNMKTTDVYEGKIPKKITLINSDHTTYTLTLLTKELFDKFVKDQIAGPLELSNDDQVQIYFLNNL